MNEDKIRERQGLYIPAYFFHLILCMNLSFQNERFLLSRGFQSTSKNARLAHLMYNLLRLKLMASNLENLDLRKSKD
jgi:hypothetical protein